MFYFGGSYDFRRTIFYLLTLLLVLRAGSYFAVPCFCSWLAFGSWEPCLLRIDLMTWRAMIPVVVSLP